MWEWFLTPLFLRKPCHSVIKNHVLVQCWAEHDVLGFQVAVHHLHQMDLEQAFLNVFLECRLFEIFASLHLKLHAVLKHHKVKSVCPQNLRSDFQGWHHVTNEELLDVLFQKMQSVLLEFETFDDKGFFLTGTFAVENLPKSSFSYDLVLVSGTWWLLIEDSILFGKKTELAKDLDDVERWGWVADFDIDLILILLEWLSAIFSLIGIHEDKSILPKFLIERRSEMRSNLTISQNLIDWEGIDGNVLKKLSIRSVKILFNYIVIDFLWLRL